jgi:PAS domain S-box-containing protein
MPRDYDDLSKAELIKMLRKLQAEPHDESGCRYAELYDFAPVGYCTLDRDGRVVEANLTASTMFGLDRAQLVGSNLQTVLRLEDTRALDAHVGKCFVDQASATSELEFELNHGGRMAVQMVSEPWFGPGRQVLGCRTAFTDIKALKRSEEKLRLLVHASDALSSSFDYASTLATVAQMTVPLLADRCIVDALADEGKLRRVEVALADPKQAALARSIKRRVPDPCDKSVQARVLETAEPFLLCDAAHPGDAASNVDGELFAETRGASAIMVVPAIARGRTLGALTFVMAESNRLYVQADLELAQDLANRAAMAIDSAQLYLAAQRAVRAREEVLAVVSHDLRNPLNAIRLNAEVLLKHSALAGARGGKKQLEHMLLGADEMNDMINDLLDVSSLDAGRLSIHLVDCGIKQIMAYALETFGPLAKARGIEFTCDARASDASVSADQQRLHQVIANLMGNAIKFTPEGGTIEMRVEILRSDARFTIRDSGPGIARAQLRHIFDRYWQARETAHKGRGLGLYIAKGIVEAQGGSIGVESTVGKGSTFFFTLPLAAAAKRSNELLRSVPIDESQRRDDSPEEILVVDDNREARAAICDLLKVQGYQALEAGNGQEALKLLRSGHSPSLMLLDLKMPVMDGWQFCAELQKDDLLANIPVVLISGGQELDVEAKALGVAGFLRKPVGLDALRATIERHAQV